MTVKEKILIIGAIDDLLIHALDFRDHFTEDEREYITEKFEEIFDTSAPKEMREALTEFGRRLLAEIKEESE